MTITVQTVSGAVEVVAQQNTIEIVLGGGSGGEGGPASETAAGIAEIATQAEVNTGTDDQRFITPSKLANSALAANVTANNAKVSYTDAAKVAGIETGATADQTGAEIKSLYEAEADTNAFTDADHSKLDGIEASADVTDATNVGSSIHGATAKTTPVDADTVGLIDSAASNVLKKLTFANLWAWIESKIFDDHREKLTGTRYYYVDPTGSDSNDGLTVGTPFLTIQKAANVIKNSLDTNGQAVVIKLADGTYSAGVTFDGLPLGVGKIYLWGNNTTPSNVKISTTSDNAVVAINGAVVDVRDMKIETTTIGDGLFALYGGVIYYGNCVFGACASSHVHADQGGACIEIINNEVDGDAASHLHATDNSRTNMLSGGTLKLTGNPNFSAYFAGAAGGSFISKPASYTFDGSATGKRFVSHKNSIIDVNGGGLDAFPGDVDGTWDTGGFYVGRSIQGVRRTEEVVLHDANANASHTGDTVLTTVLSVTLPGGLMGPNGYCKVRARWSRNSSGSGNAACVAAFGGTTISNISLATSLLALEDVRTVSNVNSESSQRALASTNSAFGAGAGANITPAVNTASDVTISFQVALANSSDTATLEEYSISTFYKE